MFSIPFTNLVIVPRDMLRPVPPPRLSFDELIAQWRDEFKRPAVTAQKPVERARPVTKRHARSVTKNVAQAVTNRCAHCGKKVSQRSTYCKGSKCRTAAYRARLKNQ